MLFEIFNCGSIRIFLGWKKNIPILRLSVLSFIKSNQNVWNISSMILTYQRSCHRKKKTQFLRSHQWSRFYRNELEDTIFISSCGRHVLLFAAYCYIPRTENFSRRCLNGCTSHFATFRPVAVFRFYINVYAYNVTSRFTSALHQHRFTPTWFGYEY